MWGTLTHKYGTCLWKITRIICQWINNGNVEGNYILSKYQAGFRKVNSCDTALQTILLSWRNALNDKMIIVVVFLYFRRAIETIDRQLLLLKLNNYGIRLNIIKRLFNEQDTNYQIQQYFSIKKRTKFDVPQGT